MNTTLPPYLYRFTKADEHCQKLIVEHKIGFTCRKNFNDPFDSKIHHTYDKARVKDPVYLGTILDGTVPPFSPQEKARLLEKMLQDDDPLTHMIQVVQDGLRVDINVHGLLCFCEHPNHILMWSHYARYHTGVCIRFKVDPRNAFYHGLCKVEYTDIVPVHDIADDSEDLMTTVFKTKAKVWDYEQEWRIIRPEIIQEGQLYQNEVFQGDLIDRVILGSQISPEDEAKITSWVGSQNIRIVKAKEIEGKFLIEIPE